MAKTIYYDGQSAGVFLPDGTSFMRGQPVEVDDALADSLLSQEFKEGAPAQPESATTGVSATSNESDTK